MAIVLATKMLTGISTEISLQIITSLFTTSKNIVTHVNNIKSYTNNEIADLLITEDVETKILILENVINELNINNNTSKSIVECINKLHEILTKIENELPLIHDKIIWNESLYILKSFRSYTFTEDVKSVNKYLKILEIRKKLLLDTIKIKKLKI